MTTRELLATSVRFTLHGMDVQALVASLRRVARVYQNQLHAKLNRFVGKESSQLMECPTIRASSLCFGAWQFVGAFSDARQVFQRDDLIVSSGGLNDAIADDVVMVLLKALLLPRQPFQQIPHSTAGAACALRGFVLELGSQIAVMVANCCDVFAAKRISFRGDCNIGSSQINAQDFLGFLRDGWLRLDLNVQVIFALAISHQRGGFECLTRQSAALKVTNIQLKSLSATHQRQRNCPVFLSKAERSRVISGRRGSELLHDMTALFGCFTVARNAPDGMNGQLRRQAKSRPDIVINQRLHRQFISHLFGHFLIHILASFTKRLKGVVDFDNLFRRDLKLARCSQDLFHEPIISHVLRNYDEDFV